MPQLFNYHIFISHAWKHSDDYSRLVTTLRNSLYFTFHDYSINADKSLTSKRVPDYQIRQSLKDQIKRASVVLVLLGMYAAYHEWIQTEVDIAVRLGKPIIGIKPWGQDRLPRILRRFRATQYAHGIHTIRDLRASEYAGGSRPLPVDGFPVAILLH